MKPLIKIRGAFFQEGSAFKFKNPNIISSRRGSEIIASQDGVIIDTDIFGIDKLYYTVENQLITISNEIRDFYHFPIDEELWPLQLEHGFLPYPFTVFKNVKKSLPGVKMEFIWDERTGWKHKYDFNGLSSFFVPKNKFNIKEFKQAFLDRVNNICSTYCNYNVISLFSGGFDSLLLSSLFRKHIVGICHYHEDPLKLKKLRDSLSNILPSTNWYIYNGNDAISEYDIKQYFNSIDEPCCDAAGFAEFLALGKFKEKERSINKFNFLSGQNSDTIFLNGREYFQEFLMDKFLAHKRWGLNLSNLIRPDSLSNKIMDYSKSTKTRFLDKYTGHKKMSPTYKKEIYKIYSAYSDALISIDRANFLGIINSILFLSNRSLEKIKTVARAYNVFYLLPFYDPEIVRLAFSVKPGHKVGYRSGKMILRTSFADIDNAPHISGAFLPRKVWHELCQANSVNDYIRFYSNKWLANKKKFINESNHPSRSQV